MSETNKITSGTKEWADSNVNCFNGCSNNCKYCYGRKMAIRFKRKTNENWNQMDPNLKAITKEYRKRKGRIMFPTSHDITPNSLEYCMIVLLKLLKSGNEVLITTKPNLWCVLTILNRCEQYKDQIQFRFTITSKDNRKLHYWEPGAPGFEERLEALQLAYRKGFKTSISIEPCLDKDPIPLIKILSPYVTETIWIGKMNYIQVNDLSPEDQYFYNHIRKVSSWSNIGRILRDINILPETIRSKIRIKDSIRNMKSKYEQNRTIQVEQQWSKHRSLGEGRTTLPGGRIQKIKGGVKKD
ncbi:MAG: radical SAM protein [Promethearchaeota archaeon]|nr:MAG: radical SAM protein [Candidatus Lokiarchaeota archaeon]